MAGVPRIRAVKKERKLYLWDWSQVTDLGPRFENLVGSQLLKYCHQRSIGSSVRYFAERTPIPRFYQVHLGTNRFETGKVEVLPFTQFCVDLGMP